MLALKYQGIFADNSRSGVVVSPTQLQQNGLKMLGILFDWEGSHDDDLKLEYSVSFHNNDLWTGLITPNILVQEGSGEFIDGVQVNITRTGFFGFLNPPQFIVIASDGVGEFRGGNGSRVDISNGLSALRIEFQ